MSIRVLVPVALLLAGCSAGVPQQEAGAAAERFAAAPPAEACRLLASQTLADLERRSGAGCSQALKGKSTVAAVVQQVEVAGESAQVRLDGQVVFLARFPQGWLVTAAGCEKTDPDPAVPYECEVEP